MEKKPDQQTRTESKTRLVGQIKTCVRAGDYARALELLRSAAAEFPQDAELSELETLAQDGIKRKAEADRLITESQELFAQQKSGEAIQLLRQAYELDKSNSLARAILANSLVEQAQSIVETDWLEAEKLANQALALNRAHPTAKTVLGLIVEQKKASSVDDWVLQASKLQSSGDLFAALAWVAEGLAVHPDAPQLLSIQDAIQRDQGARRRQARRRDLEDLRRMELEIGASPDSAAKQALAERIQGVAAKYWTDGEMLSIANGLLHQLGLAPAESSGASPKSKGSAVIFHVPRPDAAKTSVAAPMPVSRPVPPVSAPPEKAPATIPPSEVPASTAASIKAPAIPLEMQAPVTRAAEAVVEPIPAPAAKVASAERQLKQPITSKATPVILVSAAAILLIAATFFFTRKHYAPPPVATTSSVSPAISSAPVSAPATAAPTISAPIAPAPAELVPEQPAPSSDTSSGKVTLTAAPPAEPGRSVGTLVVLAGQDNAKVFLNGKLQPQLTQGGQLRLSDLELKDYVVQVAKSGFQDPPQQKVRIRKGDTDKLIFNLQPQPSLALLTIQGGAPGTAVFIDQTPVGTIQPDGTLSVASVSPGDHAVELRKERFKPRQFKKHFVAGAAITLAAADVGLEAAPSEFKISFSPADANVALVKGDHLTMVSSGVPLSLAPGTYTLTARTSDRFTRSSTLEVIAGQSRTLDLSLAPNGMSKWDNPGAWTHDKDSFVRKGGDFVLYGAVPTSGTFVLSAMPAKGHLLQWVVNYTDPRNYVLFQLDDNNFYRAVVRNGQKTDEIKIPDRGDKKSFRSLHIRVSPTEVVHQIRHGDSWAVVDRWTQPGVNLSLGKFGFYIPGNDEVALSGFAHYADLNIR